MTASYAWTITRDHIDAGEAQGTLGPSDALLDTPEAIKSHPEAVKFKMYDDDDELYYSGVAVLGDDESGFEPLDDFGMPNAGCTRIDYFERGEWRTL